MEFNRLSDRRIPGTMDGWMHIQKYIYLGLIRFMGYEISLDGR